jgi:hypothetical protein
MQKGLTQRQAAAVLGVSPPFLSKLECSWFARCPTHVEQTLREFFGHDESFASLMQDVTPDVEPEYTDPQQAGAHFENQPCE